MKNKHLLRLLQTNYTTIQAVFNDEVPTHGLQPAPAPQGAYQPRSSGHAPLNPSDLPPWMNGTPKGFQEARIPDGRRTWTYLIKKDSGIVEGDFVVVVTPSGFKVVKVVQVDAIAKIDYDADFTYKWIIQKVDTTAYEAIIKSEEAFEETMNEVERLKQRDALLASFKEYLPQDGEARRLFETATSGDAFEGVEFKHEG